MDVDNDAARGTPSLFDQTAADFTARVDKQIHAGRYRRGDLFMAAVRSCVSSQGYVLDYGCGPGRISALLARQGFRVLGLDPSPGMISGARQQLLDSLQAEFRVCESGSLEDQKEAFDGIVCSSVIEYEPQPAELLRRFSAALRPSGALILSFANSSSLSRALFQRRNLHLRAQVHTWSGKEFSQLLEQAGFKPNRKAVYFESFFDRLAPLSVLSASQFIGALGLVVAVKQ
jgi:2-polyprenyl-3-methyl-5-hydroxy-6-metoxy-1,4-benzoquinol methylase